MNTETMNTELLWQRMQKDWQSAQPTVDASDLARQISRGHRFMSACVTTKTVLTVAVTGPIAYWMTMAQGVGITLYAILLAVLWFRVCINLWIRRGTWRAQGSDTRSLLQLVERRALSRIRYAWLQIIGGCVAFPVAGALQWHMSHAQAVPGWILLGAIFVAGTIWAFRLLRRQRQKLQHTRALLEQLSREDGNP